MLFDITTKTLYLPPNLFKTPGTSGNKARFNAMPGYPSSSRMHFSGGAQYPRRWKRCSSSATLRNAGAFRAHDPWTVRLPPTGIPGFALLDVIVGRLPKLPEDTHLFLASTVGAIDLLERQTDDEPLDCLQILLNYAQERTGLRQATLVAAACASGQNAIALACGEIAAGDCRNALVIGIDITSEFVTAGFTSLGAVSRSLPRPYSVERDGLLLGEGCGALLLAEQAQNPLATVIGTTSSCDASHITAPDLAGTHLAKTIRDCLAQANLEADQLGAILGHGTGTFYNDRRTSRPECRSTYRTPVIFPQGIRSYHGRLWRVANRLRAPVDEARQTTTFGGRDHTRGQRT